MDKPRLASGVLEKSDVLSHLTSCIESLGEKQKQYKDLIQKDLEQWVIIDTMNFDTKQIFWRKKKGGLAHKLVRKIKAVLMQHIGRQACDWQYKIVGEDN